MYICIFSAIFLFCIDSFPQTRSFKLEDGQIIQAKSKVFGSSNKTAPLVIILGGFETGMNAVDLLNTHQHIEAVSIDYPYKSPHNRSFINSLTEIFKIKLALKQTDLALLHIVSESIKQHPERKICVVGVSFGVPFAINLASTHSSVNHLILAHGFAKVEKAIEAQLTHAFKESKFKQLFSPILANIAWYLLNYPKPENLAKKLKNKNILFIEPEADDIVPASSIEALKEALSNTNNKVEYYKTMGGHITPHRKSVLNEIIQQSEIWLKTKFK